MNYVSVCSGIEAATVAWHPIGWHPLAFAEIAPFPSRVLAHHYPQVPNVGDFTSMVAPAGTPCDLLVGGTPCQDFSLAGLRAGLSGARGNLTLEFCRLADRLQPRWLLWENVPGVLSSNGGRDFGAFLGALGELGYGFAWRTLDAQFFGVPQRRRRVFLVGHLGDWRRAAAVLCERTSMRRDTPSRRKERGQAPPPVAVSVAGDVAHTLRAEGFDASEDGTGRGTPVVAFAENSRGEVRLTGDITGALSTGDITGALSTGGGKPGQGYPAIAFHASQDPISGAVTPALSSNATPRVAHTLTTRSGRQDPSIETLLPDRTRVRRLTPREWERLQGFPDGYTAIPGASDTARYHALGNSMAVPCMRWIGKRIEFVDSLG